MVCGLDHSGSYVLMRKCMYVVCAAGSEVCGSWVPTGGSDSSPTGSPGRPCHHHTSQSTQ